jgi:hypothetical protein
MAFNARANEPDAASRSPDSAGGAEISISAREDNYCMSFCGAWSLRSKCRNRLFPRKIVLLRSLLKDVKE